MNRGISGVPTVDPSQIHEPILSRLREAKKADRWPWYFFGDTGRGKTCTAAHLLLTWERGGSMRGPSWMRFYDFRREHEQLCKQGVIVEPTYKTSILPGVWWAALLEGSLTVVDDVDEGADDALLHLLEMRTARPLILTGNLTPSEVRSKLGARIHSRIAGGICVEFTGPDRRLAQEGGAA